MMFERAQSSRIRFRWQECGCTQHKNYQRARDEGERERAAVMIVICSKRFKEAHNCVNCGGHQTEVLSYLTVLQYMRMLWPQHTAVKIVHYGIKCVSNLRLTWITLYPLPLLCIVHDQKFMTLFSIQMQFDILFDLPRHFVNGDWLKNALHSQATIYFGLLSKSTVTHQCNEINAAKHKVT